MMYTKKDILHYLSAHNINCRIYEHEPLFTCEQAQEIVKQLNIPGIGVKNLFLKDKAKQVYLITACDNTPIDLKAVSKTLDVKELRFANAELMMQHLGVTPGSVTPLALINDKEHAVRFLLDRELLNAEHIQIHPMQNDASVVLTPNDLILFFASINTTYIAYDFVNNISSPATNTKNSVCLN
jgi:Ala-tRNA(Pro) deacylase